MFALEFLRTYRALQLSHGRSRRSPDQPTAFTGAFGQRNQIRVERSLNLIARLLAAGLLEDFLDRRLTGLLELARLNVLINTH